MSKWCPVNPDLSPASGVIAADIRLRQEPDEEDEEDEEEDDGREEDDDDSTDGGYSE